MGQQGPQATKMTFSKMILDHMDCQNKCFLARFELVVARFGPPRIPKCLENGLFCDEKWVKNGSKMGQKCVFKKCVFPKMILDHLGCTNK